jgi:hypothetical protein
MRPTEEPTPVGILLTRQRACRGNRRRDSLAALHEVFPHHKIEINAQRNLRSCPRHCVSGLELNLLTIMRLKKDQVPLVLSKVLIALNTRLTRSPELFPLRTQHWRVRQNHFPSRHNFDSLARAVSCHDITLARSLELFPVATQLSRVL